MVRVQPGDVHLGRLASLERLIAELGQTERASATVLDEVRRQLDAIQKARQPYPRALTRAAHAVLSAGVAAMLGAPLGAVVAAAGLGLAAGLLFEALARAQHARRAAYLLAAFGGGLLATFLDARGLAPGSVVLIAGLIVLFPGYTVTTAVAELVTDNLVAGSSRMMAAALVFFQLGIGTAVAHLVMAHIVGQAPPLPVEPAGFWIQALASGVGGLALCALFQVPPRDVPYALAACFIAFLGARLGAELFGPELGVGVGAFFVTAFGNLYGRLLDRTAVAVVGPAIVLLVPGSVGYRSMLALVEKQTLAGVEIGVSMLLIAISIVTGMIAANALISPRRNLD